MDVKCLAPGLCPKHAIDVAVEGLRARAGRRATAPSHSAYVGAATVSARDADLFSGRSSRFDLNYIIIKWQVILLRVGLTSRHFRIQPLRPQQKNENALGSSAMSVVRPPFTWQLSEVTTIKLRNCLIKDKIPMFLTLLVTYYIFFSFNGQCSISFLHFIHVSIFLL